MRSRKRRGGLVAWLLAAAVLCCLAPQASPHDDLLRSAAPGGRYQPPPAFLPPPAPAGPPLLCPQRCLCSAEQAACQGGTLLDFAIPRTTQRLLLQGVAAPDDILTSESLANLSLTFVSWRGGGLRLVSAGALAPLSGLVHLDLSDNAIELISEQTFHHLTALRLLNLTRNRLSQLPQNAFQGLERLEVLYLAHNHFSVLPYQVFAPLRHLLTIDLSGNYLAALQDAFFAPNVKLVTLLLAGNRLSRIAPAAFAELQDLQSLDLYDNALHSLPDTLLAGLHDLRYLHLGHNRLEALPTRIFRDLERLLWLNISRNPLRALGGGLLAPCAHLETLAASHTNLTTLRDTDFRGLRSLKHLEITHNPVFRHIEDYALVHTPRMRYLDLRNNKLTQIPLSLKSLVGLRELLLADNPWACGCRSLWFVAWLQALGPRLATQPTAADMQCSPLQSPKDLFSAVQELPCTAVQPVPLHDPIMHQFLLGGEAHLECNFIGNPTPSITWLTPDRRTYHWAPPEDDREGPSLFWEHPHAHGDSLSPVEDARVRVNPFGALLISRVLRSDTGRYTCFASNALANATQTVILRLDPATMHEIQLVSLAVGGLWALAFLITTLIVQALRALFKK